MAGIVSDNLEFKEKCGGPLSAGLNDCRLFLLLYDVVWPIPNHSAWLSQRLLDYCEQILQQSPAFSGSNFESSVLGESTVRLRTTLLTRKPHIRLSIILFPGPFQKSSRSSSPDAAAGASAAGDAFFSSRRCLAGRVLGLQGARYLVRWTSCAARRLLQLC